MKEIALSRGFYPIVALTPEAPSTTSSTSRPASSSHHGGGKGRGKSNGRGKGKHSRPVAPSGAGPAGNGARPAGNTGLGRAAASRTGPPGSGVKGPLRFVKRPRIDEGHMLADYDVASSVIDECIYVDPGCGISDSGAIRLVMGTETWTQWRAILEEKGRANEIKHEAHEAADRSFRFGAGDIKKSRHAVSFPIDLEGNEIIVKVYVDGNVTFLIARPLLEEWGIVCDYRNRKFMILANGQRCLMLQNDKGHMIFNFLAGLTSKATVEDGYTYCPRRSVSRNSAVGILPVASVRLSGSIRVGDGDYSRRIADHHCGPYRDDTHYYISGLGQLLLASFRSSDESEPGPDFDDDGDDASLGIDVNPFGDEFLILETEFSVEGPSPTRDDQHLEDAGVLHSSAHRALFDAPLEPPLARPKVIWEVFVDEGRLSQCLEKYGSDRVTVEQFSLSNGCDFLDDITCQNLIARRDAEKPDEIFMARPCDPWRHMQNVSRAQYGADFCERLDARRAEHERCFLTLCRRPYDGQALDGLHAHIEAPWTANSIKTKTWSNMLVYDARFDQCRFQSYVTAVRFGTRVYGLVKKPTRIRSTRMRLAVQIAR